jgi:hypothetical protein
MTSASQCARICVGRMLDEAHGHLPGYDSSADHERSRRRSPSNERHADMTLPTCSSDSPRSASRQWRRSHLSTLPAAMYRRPAPSSVRDGCAILCRLDSARSRKPGTAPSRRSPVSPARSMTSRSFRACPFAFLPRNMSFAHCWYRGGAATTIASTRCLCSSGGRAVPPIATSWYVSIAKKAVRR